MTGAFYLIATVFLAVCSFSVNIFSGLSQGLNAALYAIALGLNEFLFYWVPLVVCVLVAYAALPRFRSQISRLSVAARIAVTGVAIVLGYLLGMVFTTFAGPAAM
jgi:hypothetical protein